MEDAINISEKIKKDSLRVFLGPSHLAGILWEYRQGLKQLGVNAKVVIFEEHKFKYPADIEFKLTGNKYIKVLRIVMNSPKLIHQFDVFHFVFGHSLLPAYYNFDVPLLKLLNKKIVVHFVGSEIRPRNIPETKMNVDAINKKKKLVKFWEKYADAIISHPEYSQLLAVNYHSIPIGYDLEHWKPFQSDMIEKDTNQILIVHAPSNRETKGTKYVEAAVNMLIKDGYNIKFELLEKLPNSEVREWLNASDIVVDQFLYGWHGALAVESMALAKPVLCYINDEWLNHPSCTYAKDIPLVNTTPDNIYKNLKLLIENPNLRKEIGQKSRKYVEEVHDSTKVAKQLLELYESL